MGEQASRKKSRKEKKLKNRKKTGGKIMKNALGYCGKVPDYLCSELLFQTIIVEFSQIKTAANERKLKKHHF